VKPLDGKLVALFIGLAIALVGLGLAIFGRPLIIVLNRLYAAMPGRFRYPVWWHRLVGAVFLLVGLLIAGVGLITVRG
jgi:hypothetical protein